MNIPKDPPTFFERFFGKERTKEEYALMDARLQDRHLPSGRGRVWKSSGKWFADFRAPDGTVYSAWDETPEVVTEWIYRKAARHEGR